MVLEARHDTASNAIRYTTAHSAVEPSDEALIARLIERDATAVRVLYDRYAATVYGVALALTRDAQEAEDLVQDAFLALWQHAATFDARRGCARSWLLAIVRHRALDLLRSARYKRRTLDDKDHFLSIPDSVMVEGEAVRRCECGHLLAALAELPAPQRQAVELAYFGGYAYPEIAAILGLPLGTVKSRLRIALHRLRNTPAVQELQAVG
jgi:RNA polymerase sigma-70 factor (ECF subfamily)